MRDGGTYDDHQVHAKDATCDTCGSRRYWTNHARTRCVECDGQGKNRTTTVSDNKLEFPHAVFGEVSPNEAAMDQKSEFEAQQEPFRRDVASMEDPVGLGMGAWARPFGRLNYYIGKFRLDVLRWKDGRKHRTEVGFLKFAVDELFDRDGHSVPMVALYLGTNDEGSNDSDEQPVAIFTRRGIRFLAPVHGVAALPHDPQGVSAMWSPNKKFLTQQQDDGNFVTYEFETPGDPSSRFRARWSAWSGFVANPQWNR